MAFSRFDSRLAGEKFGAGCEEICRTEVVAAGLTFFACRGVVVPAEQKSVLKAV